MQYRPSVVNYIKIVHNKTLTTTVYVSYSPMQSGYSKQINVN